MIRLPAQVATLPQALAARLAALPPGRRQRAGDLAIGVVLAVVSVLSLLPYRAGLHPLWLAVTLVAAQGIPLGWRRSSPIAVACVIGVARVAYDRIGFGFAPFPLGPAIAFYTIFERSRLAWRWITVALTAAAVAVSITATGHDVPYEAMFQLLIFATAAAAGVLTRAHRANLRAAENRADRAEADLDRRATEQAAAERARIARELHDVVAHHVSLMAVQAEAAGSLLPGEPARAQRSVDIIASTARLALTELRRLLGVLRGPSERPETAPPVSLSEISALLSQVRGAGLAVDYTVVGTPVPLPAGIDLTAYRIIQEALTNAVRHGPAVRATVTVTYEAGHITVDVTDCGPPPGGQPLSTNGKAVAGPVRPPAGPGLLGAGVLGAGLGLAGIAERVASCGGNLTLGPAAAGGFAVTARLPSS